jgi:ABC-type multidrug transport system fused ATPase/permease subunit
VVEGGRVVESGTHRDLLRAKGAYARLYELQFKGEGVHLLAG